MFFDTEKHNIMGSRHLYFLSQIIHIVLFQNVFTILAYKNISQCLSSFLLLAI